MIYIACLICFFAGYCLGVYLMRKVLNNYKEIHRLEAEQNKSKDLREIIKNIDPHVISALQYGATLIKETEQEIERTLNV